MELRGLRYFPSVAALLEHIKKCLTPISDYPE